MDKKMRRLALMARGISVDIFHYHEIATRYRKENPGKPDGLNDVIRWLDEEVTVDG